MSWSAPVRGGVDIRLRGKRQRAAAPSPVRGSRDGAACQGGAPCWTNDLDKLGHHVRENGGGEGVGAPRRPLHLELPRRSTLTPWSSVPLAARGVLWLSTDPASLTPVRAPGLARPVGASR